MEAFKLVYIVTFCPELTYKNHINFCRSQREKKKEKKRLTLRLFVMNLQMKSNLISRCIHHWQQQTGNVISVAIKCYLQPSVFFKHFVQVTDCSYGEGDILKPLMASLLISLLEKKKRQCLQITLVLNNLPQNGPWHLEWFDTLQQPIRAKRYYSQDLAEISACSGWLSVKGLKKQGV